MWPSQKLLVVGSREMSEQKRIKHERHIYQAPYAFRVASSRSCPIWERHNDSEIQSSSTAGYQSQTGANRTGNGKPFLTLKSNEKINK